MSQAKVASHNIEMLIKGKNSDLQTYYADTPGIGLSLGFVSSSALIVFLVVLTRLASIRKSDSGIRLRLTVNRPWRQAFKPFKTKGNMDAGCRKVWDRRAPGVKDYDL